MTDRRLDLVLHGATGYVGRLTARHLAERAGGLRVGLSGRSEQRLRAVRNELGVDWPLLVTDASDRASVVELAFDLSAFLSNSRTTATSTTEAPGSASERRSASAVFALTSSSLLVTSIMGILLGSDCAPSVRGGARGRYQENHVGVRNRASAPTARKPPQR